MPRDAAQALRRRDVQCGDRGVVQPQDRDHRCDPGLRVERHRDAGWLGAGQLPLADACQGRVLQDPDRYRSKPDGLRDPLHPDDRRGGHRDGQPDTDQLLDRCGRLLRMRSLRRDETGVIPFAKLIIIGSVIAVVAVLLMLVLSVVPAGDKEDTELFYCPDDGTYVDDPLKCPSGHPLSLGVYSTIIRVTFLDGTTATLTKQTLFDALTLRYQNKDVSSFLFMSSYATGDAAMRVRVRPEISLEIASLNTIVRGTTGDFVDKTIPKGTTTNLFSMKIGR